jgi:uncharacterized protein YigA (DUF484 family)
VNWHAVHVGGSEGIIARCRDVVALFGADTNDELRERLLAVMEQLGNSPTSEAGQLARRFIGTVIEYDASSVGSVAAARLSPLGIEVLLIGAADANWRSADDRTASMSSASAAAFFDPVLPSDAA